MAAAIAADPSVGQELEAAVLTGKTEHFIARLAQALLIPHRAGAAHRTR